MNHQLEIETPHPHQHLPKQDRMLDAEDLLGTASQIQIKLDSQIYTLRRTRFGKLLLTK